MAPTVPPAPRSRVRVAAGDASGATARRVDPILAAAAAPPPRAAPAEAKDSAFGELISAFQVGQPQWTPRSPAALADFGYCQSVVNFFCINIIAGAFGSLVLAAYQGDKEIGAHPALALLRQPNPTQSGGRFRRAWMSHHLVAGHSYLEGVPAGLAPPRASRPAPPKELWTHRPDRMRVIPGPRGLPMGYRYETGGGYRDFDVDQITGRGWLAQFKDFHPLSDWYGLGAIEAAARWGDLHNAGAAANAALLMNGGNPSAMFSTKSHLTDPQKAEVRARLHQMFSGTSNWGEPLILGGDWLYQRISATMADMQWIEGMHEAARNLCTAWGVPFTLVVPGESTYSNREAADLELYDHAVLPRAIPLLEDLSVWLAWLYDEPELSVRIDIEAIPALETRRQGKRKAVRDDIVSGVISLEEGRAEGGYGKINPKDHFLFGPFAAPAPNPVAPPQVPVTSQVPVAGVPQGNPALPKPAGATSPAAAPPKPPQGGRPALAVVQGGRRGDGDEGTKARPSLEVAAGPLHAALRVDPASAAALARWATDQGVGGVVDPAAMHVTTVFSRTPVPLYEPAIDAAEVAYPAGHGLRLLGPPDRPALVLTVASDLARLCHDRAAALGAAWDFPDYAPHVTLAQPFAGVLPAAPPPFAIGLGPEHCAPLDPADLADDPSGKAADAGQPRHPGGKPEGGQFRPRGPEDAPTAAETAEAAALAAALVDDALLADQLAPVLRDAAEHFARREPQAATAAAKAMLTDPVRAALGEFWAELPRRAALAGVTTRQRLALALARAMRAGADLATATRGTFAGFAGDRAATVAQTEVIRAAGYGTQLAAELGGLPFKEWLSRRDPAVREAHAVLDGQIVPTNDVFRVDGLQAAHPGAFGVADQDCGCRCVLVPLRSEAEAKAAGRDRAARWAAMDTEVREFEARALDAVRRGFEAQERRAVVRLHERARGAA